MAISRTMNPQRLNEVINHPDVRPWVGAPGVEPLDVGPIVANSLNFAFEAEGGGFIAVQQGPGRYEWHSMFRPENRGAGVVRAMREALRYMFVATDCLEILTKVPSDNEAALGLVRMTGGVSVFDRPLGFVGRSGERVDLAFWKMDLDRWTARDEEALGRGRWFHERLEAAKRAAGSTLRPHEEDENHDRAVGASVLMFLAGNPRKATGAYNRWAALTGYQPVELLSETPIVVDVRDAIVSVVGPEMEILLCR